MTPQEEKNVLMTIATIFCLNILLYFFLSNGQYRIFSYLLINFSLGIFFIAILLNYLFDIFREGK